MRCWRTARTPPAPSESTSADVESELSSPSRPTRSATVSVEAAPAAAHRPSTPRPYRPRNAVERCINQLKQWRGLAMRTDKLAITYQAALHLASILIWARR